ncbi:MAG: DUF1850 domain-containing protein [Rhodocyclaceae bacterium]|nr:DUF1850 domain-containing protein [Rhodocyclaceae bacterium]
MSGLCIAAASLLAFLPLQAFTLAWTHSIEKIRWEEDWRIEDGRLRIVEARIRGSGAGMEPPEGAVLEDGVWHYMPRLAPVERLRLANSNFTAGYKLCAEGRCRPLAELASGAENEPLELYACEGKK